MQHRSTKSGGAGLGATYICIGPGTLPRGQKRAARPVRCKGNRLQSESWEGQLSNENISGQNSAEPADKKKPYKSPSLRFEPVFEVSALACGKIAGTSSVCNASKKVS